MQTQLLLGQRVLVLERQGDWARISVPGQPSPKLASGYPGWVPAGQLIPGAVAPAAQEGVVTRPTTWAFRTAALRSKELRLSYGTRLPLLTRSARAVSVRGPDGGVLWLPAAKVAVVERGAAARRVTAAAVVAEARRFRGLAYLWGGTSGFAFDCSGLTHAVYAQLGITLPRDATPQFGTGTPVAEKDLRQGDLVFFPDRSGAIHHVGIYAGGGRMIHAPRTGKAIQYASINSGVWARELAGVRRYL